MEHPVVLVHGWGGSYVSTWRASGFADLLEDAGRTVVGVDLLGHGTAPKPHDPEAYSDLTSRVLEAAPDSPCDFVGFSLGAMTVLQLAIDHPERVHRLILAGIGRNVLEAENDEAHRRLVQALEGDSASDDDPSAGDNIARLFVQYADQPGNDRAALTAVMKRRRAPFAPDELARVTCPVLVVIGDHDFAGPGEPLARALPNARLVTLRKVDHFATTENFGFFDAAFDFLGAA
ncbi:MAG: alpha/beta fold hydrolase [Ilumatobacteraceae bacterium]